MTETIRATPPDASAASAQVLASLDTTQADIDALRETVGPESWRR